MPAKQRIIKALRSSITNGEYKPGERLIEANLAKRFKVSRTPIREVLNQLEKEHFIEIIPNVGAEVVTLSLKNVADIYDILIVLEGVASRLATSELVDEQINKLEEYQVLMITAANENNYDLFFELNIKFHRLITEATKNPYLIDFHSNFRNLIYRFASYLAYVPEQGEITLDAHRKIIDAFKMKNPALARFVMEEHLESAKKLLIEYLKKLSGNGNILLK